MAGENLFQTPETLLPAEAEVASKLEATGRELGMLRALAANYPASSQVWAVLADASWDPERAIPSYAFARVGYHRGLDALRGAGWRGQGPIPWSHEPNRGFLRCLWLLERAAKAIGEDHEAKRLAALLHDADPDAAAAIEAERQQAIAAGPPTEAIVIRSLD